MEIQNTIKSLKKHGLCVEFILGLHLRNDIETSYKRCLPVINYYPTETYTHALYVYFPIDSRVR